MGNNNNKTNKKNFSFCFLIRTWNADEFFFQFFLLFFVCCCFFFLSALLKFKYPTVCEYLWMYVCVYLFFFSGINFFAFLWMLFSIVVGLCKRAWFVLLLLLVHIPINVIPFLCYSYFCCCCCCYYLLLLLKSGWLEHRDGKCYIPALKVN